MGAEDIAWRITRCSELCCDHLVSNSTQQALVSSMVDIGPAGELAVSPLANNANSKL